MALSVSVGEMRRLPVMAIEPALWSVASCFKTLADPLNLRSLLSPCMGWHHRSAPYMIFGRATLMYSLRAYFGVMPHVGLAILRIWAAHFPPFSIAYACWAFQLRCWSSITPRYLVLGAGLTSPLGRAREVLSFVLAGCAKSTNVSLEYSSGELCVLDQLMTPPLLVIISASSSCASSKVLAMAISRASSTYAMDDSSLLSGISMRSAL